MRPEGMDEAIEDFEPGLSARLMDGYTDVEITHGVCRKCGIDVRITEAHVEWHRNLTLAMNFQSYKAAMAYGILDTILTNVAASGVSLDELVTAAVKARAE